MLMPIGEFVPLLFLSDVELAERFAVPLEQVAIHRGEMIICRGEYGCEMPHAGFSDPKRERVAAYVKGQPDSIKTPRVAASSVVGRPEPPAVLQEPGGDGDEEQSLYGCRKD